MKSINIPGISPLLRRYVFAEELPLEARLLNTIYLVGIFAALTADITRFAAGNNPAVIVIISAIVILVVIMMYITNQYHVYTVPRWIIVIVLCNVLFPSAYFALGGLDSAMPGYFVLSIVLIFFLTWGKSRIIFLITHVLLVCLCYYLSSLPFFARFVMDNGGINRYLDHIQTFVVVGLCIGFMVAFQNTIYKTEKEKTAAAGVEAKERNKLLKVVNQMAEMLLSSEMEDLEKAVSDAMEVLSRCVDSDRMYVWRNRTVNGKPCYEQHYEWLSDIGRESTLRRKTGYSFISAIPEWENAFSGGQCVYGPVASLSEHEQKILSPFGICSILVIPLFLQKNFWGFVSFDDCRHERKSSDEELSILRSGSLMLANAIMRHDSQKLIDARMQQQELMARISQHFISREPMENLIANALRQMGEFLGVTRILVAVADKETEESHPAYTWFAAEKWKPKPVQTGFNDFITTTFPKSVPPGGYAAAVCCNDIINEDGGKYKIFSIVGLRAFIWAPVYVDGVFWGLISVEECEHTRIWNESDVQLTGTVSSAIAGAVARDIIDKERAAALEQAVHASKAKGDFLANMSHEMRTPMNAIIGMTAIGKNSEDMKKKDYAFEKIENASSHLLGVINDILDMSKIEANKLELSNVTFGFEKMLQKVVNVINFRIDERRQNFTVHIDENIPRFLIGDDQRLAQVITNLLSNAVKFTPEQGSIRLATKLAGEENGIFTIQIEVKDSGIGISREQQEKLFNSFEQAESGTARKFGGTGLGLAISKRIVEMMGGRIWIESELGKGSTFAFTIQAEKGHGAHASMLSPGVNIKNVRILAIDDTPEILEYLADIMHRFGVKCDIAKDGPEAISFMEKNGPYDLYFVDWKMPGMDGIEVSRRIKENTADKSVVIMISAAEWNTVEKEAQAAGVDKFLPKPLFPSAIADVINECLGDNTIEAAQEKSGWKEVDHFDGYTILLAEDVDINREIVLTLLEPTALAIDCAENGAQAVDMFRAAPDKYDMIFMDVQMPEMDGYEATGSIRAMDGPWAKKVPIVAMTANVFREDIEKCIASGMNDHVGKPLDLTEVLEKLRKYLPLKSAS
jgi:signal transduction histidine kinase/DNA-binding response OmpR family regulator